MKGCHWNGNQLGGFERAVGFRHHQIACGGTPTISNCTTITRPGSYTSINNITATTSNVNGGACILIQADFVTFNLAGFAITGSNLPFFIQGIATSGNHNGIYVHSGTIANFSDVGVNLSGDGLTVEGIRAVNNSGGGISASNPGGKNGHWIVGNTAISNGDFGINVFCPAVVLENVAAGNGAGTTGEQIVAGFTAYTAAENSPSIASTP
jgi:hypothetical protein